MDLGHRVRDLRNAQHLSQIELAARAGVARNTLNRIENGHLMPTAPVIERLAEALEVTPGALFGDPTLAGKGAAAIEELLEEQSVPLDEELTSQEWARHQGARLHGMDSETWDDYLRAHDTVEELGETWKEIFDESRMLHAALSAHKWQRPQEQGRRQTLARGLKDLRMHRYADLNASAMLLHAEALVDEIFSAMRKEAYA